MKIKKVIFLLITLVVLCLIGCDKICEHHSFFYKEYHLSKECCAVEVCYEECDDCGYKRCLVIENIIGPALNIFHSISSGDVETASLDCRVCGLEYIMERKEDTYLNCKRIENYVFTIKDDSNTLLNQLEFSDQFTDHKNTEDRVVDLLTYGACGGSVEGKYCLDCDKFIYVSVDIPCIENSLDTYLHCDICNFTFDRNMYQNKEEVYPCIFKCYSGDYIEINGKVLLDNRTESYISEHSYLFEYTHLGASCEDGTKVKRTCSECKNEFSYETVIHYRDDHNIPLPPNKLPQEKIVIDEVIGQNKAEIISLNYYGNKINITANLYYSVCECCGKLISRPTFNHGDIENNSDITLYYSEYYERYPEENILEKYEFYSHEDYDSSLVVVTFTIYKEINPDDINEDVITVEVKYNDEIKYQKKFIENPYIGVR